MNSANLAGKSTLYTLFANASRNASTNGTGVDISACRGSMIVTLLSTAMSSGDTNDVKLQESANNSDWSDIAGATFTQVTDAAASSQRIAINADAAKAYIRAVATFGGDGTPSATFGVQALGWTT